MEPHPVPKSSKKTPARRIGFDGTLKTPSRELLKSTVCSRSHQIHPHDDDDDDEQQKEPISPLSSITPPPEESSEESVLDGSLDSSLMRSPDQNNTTNYRVGCENPVALTLLNNGKEDLEKLLERDTDAFHGDDSTSASCPSVMKVSSSLLDVMDQSDVAELARPVPFRASRSEP